MTDKLDPSKPEIVEEELDLDGGAAPVSGAGLVEETVALTTTDEPDASLRAERTPAKLTKTTGNAAKATRAGKPAKVSSSAARGSAPSSSHVPASKAPAPKAADREAADGKVSDGKVSISRTTLGLVLLAAVIVAFAGTIGYLLLRLHDEETKSNAFADTKSSAEHFVSTYFEIMSAPNVTAAEIEKQLVPLTTGKFSDLVKSTLTDKKFLDESKIGNLQPTVVSSMVENYDEDQAKVVLVVDLSANGTLVPGGSSQSSLVEVQLNHVDGEWRVSGLGQIGGTAASNPAASDGGQSTAPASTTEPQSTPTQPITQAP